MMSLIGGGGTLNSHLKTTNNVGKDGINRNITEMMKVSPSFSEFIFVTVTHGRRAVASVGPSVVLLCMTEPGCMTKK